VVIAKEPPLIEVVPPGLVLSGLCWIVAFHVPAWSRSEPTNVAGELFTSMPRS
jgi:hypothetical protein